jgi:hypothetical protein
MDFIKPVSIIVSGIFTGSMIHTFMVIPPFIQPVINGILIGVDQCSWLYSGLYQRLNGGLPDIGEHLNYNLPTPLYHPENRWFLFFQRTTPSITLLIGYGDHPGLFFDTAWVQSNSLDYCLSC